MRLTVFAVLCLLCLLGVGVTAHAGVPQIVRPEKATARTALALREVRRYLYVRTGELPALADKLPANSDVLVLRVDPALATDAYRLETRDRSVTISGGSDLGLLYGAYRYAELLGVRFYLHGDVVPDERLRELPAVNETGAPLFDTRGIQPFHDFPEGPDWWNQDDYLAYVSQLAKLRMNFLGLHCYPEGGVGPEPLVWIGLPQDVGPDGAVAFGYASQWASTLRGGMWGYATTRTSEFAGGASLLFAADDYGPDVMQGLLPTPSTPEQGAELFNRVGRQLAVVTAHARRLGVKTCIGTETPLTIPKAVQARLRQQGRNPADPAVVRELYTGMFKRIAATSPVDYYWLWTPEGWTWGGNNPQQFEATTRDIQAALDALQSLGNPFTLATSGWVLGPQHDRAALDAFLPKNSPLSCINRQVGHEGVEPAFANIVGRPKWAIPWMENDPNLVGPQPWAARMRHDAVDARRFGCTGLLGIHWRTKALSANVAALAGAAWDQSWVPADFDARPVKTQKVSDGAAGGNTAAFTAPVADAGATPQAVYQNVRYNLNAYNLTVPDGTYTVTLQFNEPHYTAAGKRVFGVSLQGRPVVTNLDVFARVGQNKALTYAFPDTAVTNGCLRVDFTPVVEFPCIAGIVVEGRTRASNQLAGEPFARRVNCGGGKAGDYEADRVAGGGAPSPRQRAMPIEAFYVDFARAHFGAAVAEPAGRLFARLDGVQLPQASDWKSGPGDLVARGEPWEQARKQYAFVDELAALRVQVKGAGNLERFDYWLNTYRGMAAMAEVCCGRGRLDRELAAVAAEKDVARKRERAGEALTARMALADAWTRLLTHQTAIADTPGELGTIANLEQHTRRQRQFVEGHDKALAEALGAPLPPACTPAPAYAGPPRITVLSVRGAATPGEALTLRIIALDRQPVKGVVVKVRPLGKGDWRTLAATHAGRAVWTATLPPAADDFEYQIAAETAAGATLAWPPTAPALNQTVIVAE